MLDVEPQAASEQKVNVRAIEASAVRGRSRSRVNTVFLAVDGRAESSASQSVNTEGD
jgi:hypothetical protein